MIAFVATLALAYESDQLTWRERQLLDSTSIADDLMSELLAEAAARANERTGCAAPPDEVHAVLAEEVHRATSRGRLVWERGLTRAPGFSVYSALLERSEADRFAFERREDIFGDLTVWHSVILTLAGPCSTFEIAGVRIGSDKLDHFLDEGFNYWAHAQRRDLERALARGTATERSFFGLLTSKAFSWADLHANYEGYLFYEALLDEDRGYFAVRDGCVVEARPFSWRDWIDADYDEVLNPPTFTRLVERGVQEHLRERTDQVCASRQAWNTGGWYRERLATLVPDPEYVVGPAPERTDPFQLDRLCRGETLAPHPIRPRRAIREARRRLTE